MLLIRRDKGTWGILLHTWLIYSYITQHPLIWNVGCVAPFKCTWSAQISEMPFVLATPLPRLHPPSRRQSACLPLNSIVIHRTDRPTIQEIKCRRRWRKRRRKSVLENRLSPLCPSSFPDHFSGSYNSRKNNGTLSLWGTKGTSHSRRPVRHTFQSQQSKLASTANTQFQVLRNWLFMLQLIHKRYPPDPDIWALLAVKIPIWWKD